MATVSGPQDAGHVESAPRSLPPGPRGFGLTPTTALLLGSIIGVGIFNLLTSLAACGAITPVSMGLRTIGALALALLFVAMSRRLQADGGLYAYAGRSRKT